MKAAIIYPAHVSVIEKTAALFGQLDVLMVSPSDEVTSQGKLNANRTRLKKEGPELGFSTTWLPLVEANLSSYDVVIDTWEARGWEPAWHELSWKLDVPRIIKISWYTPGVITLTDQDWDMFDRSVVLTDSIVAADEWLAAGVENSFVPWFPGDWWFEQQWTGEDNRALFVLAGAYEWRGGPEKQPRLRDWLTLTEHVPGYHLDAADKYRSQLELAKEVARFCCYVNLDGPTSSRHLSLSFTEALAAGVPCLVIDRPQHDYVANIRFDITGYTCKDLTELSTRALALINKHSLAARMSVATKQRAREWFGRDVVMAEWERAIEHAQYLHRNKT